MISYKQLAENFIERDNEAVDEYNNGYKSIENRIDFINERLKDLCTVMVILLNKLDENERESTNTS